MKTHINPLIFWIDRFSSLSSFKAPETMTRRTVVVIINSRSILVGEGHDPRYSYLFMRNVRTPIDFSTLTPSARYTSTTLSPFHACSAGEQSRRNPKRRWSISYRGHAAQIRTWPARITNWNRYYAKNHASPRTRFVFLDVSSGPVEWREIKSFMEDGIEKTKLRTIPISTLAAVARVLLKHIGNIFDRILKILIVLFWFVLSWACAN